ncbi:T9SS type B sorting domain-containing protein [Flavobacterium sp. LS1R49]|uniref:T9SS type B sorting domain-containing protein n=1 Tax=Flavobacterium shii TaxID=2987687 RepID=A0A9X3C7F1_9FLAO|nr:T9SS type B sorting domain-containing protein [Flavobacterium shii]MCV9928273.1 T9SS type B sorting domain-containing protein [Flavobacterium shii]
MKHKLLLFIFIITTKSIAQTIQWQNTIGGDNVEWCNFIELTNDGNYISGGYSYSNISGDKNEISRGLSDYWFFKIDDATGNLLWQKTIGGNKTDNLTSAKETQDGGYILGGYTASGISGEKTQSSRGNDDYWVVKLDVNRNIVWDKTYGGSGVDRLRTIIQTDDGGYLMGGESTSNISGDKTENRKGTIDIWLIKIDAFGAIMWQKTIGGDKSSSISSIIKTTDHNYAIAASSTSSISGDKTQNSKGISDYWILKIDQNGAIIWQNTIGGNNGDSAVSIVETNNGNYIVGGNSSSKISGDKTQNTVGNSVDVWLVKLNNNGQLIWQKDIGGGDTENLNNLKLTADNGLILGILSYSEISGNKTEASRGECDYWLVKLDSNYNIEWDKTIGGNDVDTPQAVVQSRDGNYVAIGWSDSNMSGDKTENNNGDQDIWAVKVAVCDQTSTTSNSPVCINSELKLFAEGGTNYSWTGPNGFTSTDQNPIITNATLANRGEYSCTTTGTSTCNGTKKTTVIIADTQAPIPDTTNLPTITGNCHTIVSSIPTATDTCAGVITAITTNPLSYTLPGTYTIVWNYNDGNGNSSSQKQTIIVVGQALPTTLSKTQTFCANENTTISDININGTSIIWYDAPTAGNILSDTTLLQNNTYYASQTINNCESERLPINIKIQDTEIPTGEQFQSFCIQKNATINTIKIDGDDVKWYDAITLGTNLSESTLLENGIIYYASQTINNCESNRTPITIQILESTKGECINYMEELPFPKFFTPNNDGHNDYWTIDFVSLKPNSSIKIFDRYGNFIKELHNNDTWDGTSVGRKEPTSDYWFTATRLNGKEYRGHFTLKR